MGSIGNSGDSFLIDGYSEATGIYKFNQDSNYQEPDGGGLTPSDSFDVSDFINSPDTLPSYDSNHLSIPNPGSSSSESSELSSGAGDYSPTAPDFPDACIKYLTDILMEEDLDDTPNTAQGYMALQATEKSLYDAIGESYSIKASDQFPASVPPNVQVLDEAFNTEAKIAESSHALQTQSSLVETSSPSSGSASGPDETAVAGLDTSAFSSLLNSEITKSNFDWIHKALSGFTHVSNPEAFRSVSAVRKIHQRDRSDQGEEEYGRSSKHIAAYVEDDVQMEQYDDILLANCKAGGPPSTCWENKKPSLPDQEINANAKGSKAKQSRRKKKQSNHEDALDLDLSPLLTQCAQAVATFDFNGANEMLKRIRQHSSPYGDDTQRLAHYFADALEARMAGTASDRYSDFINWQISASSFFKAYRFYVSAVPFKRTSFFVANKTIKALCVNATRVHIIDFGIFCGIQWPCLIQALSQRPNGPPVLRITAVEFPERGYKPAARIEETGRRLSGYCKRFGVPFEYQAIAQTWDTLQPDDFTLKSDEVLVVNCLYRAGALLDDTVEVDSPRDAFLKLIKKLKPDLFIHGIVNGKYNAPFFTTRFKEALFHFSSIFDMFEATMPREEEERRSIERGIYGRDILNVVACEGTERVDRPETYKQWQVRNQRAGLRQVALDREIVGCAKAMVRANYHKDFVVDEVNNWMLQGWKGRLLLALSCWKPA